MSNFLNFAGNQGVTFKNHGTGGGTSFTLDVSASTNSVLLTVGGVLQAPGTDYTVSGTTITTTSSVTAGIEVLSWVVHKPGTAPVIQDNSVTGAKIALSSQAAGDIMYYNGTAWVRLAKGTASQLLAMNSGATAPEWVAPGGGWTFVSETALTAVPSVDFTGLTATSQYQFVLSGIYPSTAGAELGIRFYWSSAFKSGVYDYNFVYTGTDGDAENGGPNNGYIPIGPDLKNSGPQNVMGIATVAGLESGTNAFIAYNLHVYDNSASFYGHVTGVGRQADTIEVTGVRFLMSSGNFAASGSIKMYSRVGA